jgi:hypothetical protein
MALEALEQLAEGSAVSRLSGQHELNNSELIRIYYSAHKDLSGSSGSAAFPGKERLRVVRACDVASTSGQGHVAAGTFRRRLTGWR